MLRLDSERLGTRSQDDYDRLVACVLTQLQGYDAVVLSDYAKGVFTPEVCQTII
jgi:D-beta-D-heptose 7-phosphate kinase/D-beta-D-heptose 1-phosphate adenosyltransferase